MDRGWVEKKEPGRDAWRRGKEIAGRWLQCSHFPFPKLTYPMVLPPFLNFAGFYFLIFLQCHCRRESFPFAYEEERVWFISFFISLFTLSLESYKNKIKIISNYFYNNI